MFKDVATPLHRTFSSYRDAMFSKSSVYVVDKDSFDSSGLAFLQSTDTYIETSAVEISTNIAARGLLVIWNT